jgi:hypothetical protein
MRGRKGVEMITAKTLKHGYNPMVVDDAWGHQLLIQLWFDDDGTLSCSVARRENSWDTWSPPIEARHA